MTHKEDGSRPTSSETLRTFQVSPPFINELLKTYPEVTTDKTMFDQLLIEASQPDNQLLLLLDQMNGEIDRTRFVSEFIGTCDSSEEIQAKLGEIAFGELQQLAQEPEQLQQEVYSMLDKKTCTTEALLWLDKEHGKVTQSLKSMRHPDAEAFRTRNLQAIQKAEHSETEIPKNLFETFINSQRVQRSMPEVQYIPTYYSDKLIAVHQRAQVPHLPEKNREILIQLTPKIFQREHTSGELDPRTLNGFMWHFRKAGDPLVRGTADMIRTVLQNRKDDRTFNDLNYRVKEYFESHP